MEAPPPRRVNLREGLPKLPTPQVIEDLKTHLYANETNKEKYFPLDKQNKYQNNFRLFDRNYDQVLDFEELKEFMVSVGQVMPDTELEDFYKHLKQDNGFASENGRQEYGITLPNIYLIISKKLREEDMEEQLAEAFRIVDQKNQGYVESEPFKELLMTNGLKWSEDQADEFLKDFDPKGDGKFNPADVVKKLLKR